MKAEAGTVCRCQSKLCGCEVLIKQLAPVGLEGTVCRCFCGTAMKRPYERPSVLKSKNDRGVFVVDPAPTSRRSTEPTARYGTCGDGSAKATLQAQGPKGVGADYEPEKVHCEKPQYEKMPGKVTLLWTAGKTTTKDYWGFLMSALACSMLPLTSSVFTSDFCPAWSVTSVSKLL
jgi:hypothetical protein